MPDEIGRRELIKLGAGAALVSTARAAGKPKFFTPAEYLVVDELTEMIIPADEKSGGAKAARVADFIDSTLAEAFEQQHRDLWRKGLQRFLTATPEQRLAMLTDMSGKDDLFFHDLKGLTIRGYYTSKIGIHDDLGYLGNTYQRDEYAGHLPNETLAGPDKPR